MEVFVLPLQQQKWSLIHDKLLAKASSMWLEDMSQKHIPVHGKMMCEKALSLCEYYCDGVEENEGV